MGKILQPILNNTTAYDPARLPKTSILMPLQGLHVVVSLNAKMLVVSRFVLKLILLCLKWYTIEP